jgi:hypothetical protein
MADDAADVASLHYSRKDDGPDAHPTIRRE